MMTKCYSFLSQEYDSIFQNNLEVFRENIIKSSKRYQERKYCLFYPSFGTDKVEEVDFLIYGQATKGWMPNFTIEDADFKNLSKVAKEYSNLRDDNLNPLDWVNINWSNSTKKLYPNHKDLIDGYNTCRSFFWNVIYKLISDYYRFSRNEGTWSSRIVWSNLMKIAPAERANPNYAEWEAQLPISVELFKKEIEEVKPKYAVLLTNKDWADPFVKGLEPIDHQRDKEVILSVMRYFQTYIIVTKRPFRGNNNHHVEEIMKLISILEKNKWPQSITMAT